MAIYQEEQPPTEEPTGTGEPGSGEEKPTEEPKEGE